MSSTNGGHRDSFQLQHESVPTTDGIAGEQGRFRCGTCLWLSHLAVLLWISAMYYLHIAEPITNEVLSRHQCEVIRPTDSFANSYLERAAFWLRVSYACTIAGVVQFVVLLSYRKVEVVFQAILVLGLCFLQVADHLQRVWLFESYQVLIVGV